MGGAGYEYTVRDTAQTGPAIACGMIANPTEAQRVAGEEMMKHGGQETLVGEVTRILYGQGITKMPYSMEMGYGIRFIGIIVGDEVKWADSCEPIDTLRRRLKQQFG